MIIPMKIYTKTGDDGSTGLIGGGRVSKSDGRIDCIGAVDELNAAIGWAAVGAEGELLKSLRAVQNELFVIGSHLASPDGKATASVPALDESAVGRMEMEIDAATAKLPPLRDFILPGGCETTRPAAPDADDLPAGGAGFGGIFARSADVAVHRDISQSAQ